MRAPRLLRAAQRLACGAQSAGEGLAGPCRASATPLLSPSILSTYSASPLQYHHLRLAPAAGAGLSTASPSSSSRTASNSGSASRSSGASSGGGSSPSANPVVQKYQRLLDTGGLQRDEQQAALVQQLAALYDQICAHRERMDAYHRDTEEFQARRLERLQEMLAAERQEELRLKQREQEEQERRGQAAGGGSGGSSGTGGDSKGSMFGWLRSTVVSLAGDAWTAAGGSGGSGGGALGSSASGDSPMARARRAAAQREERLQREMGPPPVAPEPPTGMYVWGSVGSGKSMLVALFYQALVEAAQLPASRWMHFNAAMLEVHSRLHHLDTERWRLRDARHAAVAAALQAGEGDGGDSEEEEEEDHAGDEEAVVAGVGEVPLSRQGVMRHWDPKHDPEVQRQREARAAMLAVRRHMRLARLGRSDPRGLAAANAEGLVRMAASFIRGRAGDPLSGWAGGSGPVASVLYFDEVQVTDVFSALALKGLVEALTAAGCVVVCTSNRAPHELPRHGLHEAMWEHFVETLLRRCTVHELSSPADYRRVLLEQGRASIAASGGSTSTGSASWPPVSRSYLHPAGPDSTAELERLWRACAGASGAGAALTTPGATGREEPINVPVLFGRWLEVRRASACGGVAWFNFVELCGRPLGPADYVALGQRFHTVFLADIPAMSMQVRDQARRFITLVDELYNARCVLVASAQVPPEELFVGTESDEPILDLEGLQFETAVDDARLRRDTQVSGGVAPVAATPATMAAAMGALGGAEERFAFRRAVSRLLEMQSPQYILGALRMRQIMHQQ